MALTITIDSVDVTDSVKIDSINISEVAESGQVATCDLTIIDDGNSLTIEATDDVDIDLDGTTMFAGEVAGAPNEKELAPDKVEKNIHCQGYGKLLHETVVTETEYAYSGPFQHAYNEGSDPGDDYFVVLNANITSWFTAGDQFDIYNSPGGTFDGTYTVNSTSFITGTYNTKTRVYVDEDLTSGDTWMSGTTFVKRRSDSQIISDLFSDHEDSWSIDASTNVDTEKTYMQTRIVTGNCTLAEALESIAEATGANPRWWIDYSKNLHWTSSPSTNSDGLSDGYDGSSTFRYWGLDVQAEQTLINKVYVVGRNTEGNVISKWVTDASSISSYGEREHVVVDYDINTEEGLEDLGQGIIDANKDPSVSAVLWTYHDGFSAGEFVEVTSSVYGWSAESLFIRRIDKRFFLDSDGNADVEYQLHLGDSPWGISETQAAMEQRIRKLERREVADAPEAGGTSGGAPTDAQYLTLALTSALTAERQLIPGDGLNGTDSATEATYTLDIDVSDFIGDGLRDSGSETIAVDVSDFAGAGLEDDGSESLRIAAAAAGDGLQGGAGSALAVDVSDFAGDGLEDDGSENLRVDEDAAFTWTGTHHFDADIELDADLDFQGAQSITTTAGNLTIAPVGDVVFNPTGDDILPNTNYDLNLGSISNKYLTLHAAELWVQTLVAQDVIATIGGRVLVGPTTSLAEDLSNTSRLDNPGFESAGSGGSDVFADWTEVASDGSIDDETTSVKYGSHACKLTAGASTDTRVQQSYSVLPGEDFTLWFWTRGDGTYDGHYYVYDVTNGAYVISDTATGVTGTTYARVTKGFNVPAGCNEIKVNLVCPSTDGGVAYFDGVNLYDSTLTVEHNEMAVGDICYLDANGKVEFMSIEAGPTGSGPYEYRVERDKDGTNPNDWYAGDAVFNTGAAGDGFIDLYSVDGVDSNGAGPTIVGNVRQSATYNDWEPRWAIGNLNSLYGVGANDYYGVGIGDYSGGNYMLYESNASDLIIKAKDGDISLDSDGLIFSAPTSQSADYSLLFKRDGVNRAEYSAWATGDSGDATYTTYMRIQQYDTSGNSDAYIQIARNTSAAIRRSTMTFQLDSAATGLRYFDFLDGDIYASEGVAIGKGATDGGTGPSDGVLLFVERSSDPTEPSEGEAVIWMSDGTGKGDDGDVMIASQAGGTTNYDTLFDHSAGTAW
jgi:hypothetical protein